MPNQSDRLTEQEFDPSVVPAEEQVGEEFLADALGLGETKAAVADVDTVEEPVEESQEDVEEAIQEEDYTKDEDGLELDPADALPDTPVVPKETSKELDATDDQLSKQSPEFRAMIEQQRQLRRMVTEQQAELEEFRRQREQAELKDEEFLTDQDDMDAILSDPKALNTLLNRVYKKGIADSKEHTLKSFDAQLDRKLRVHTDRRARAERFFSANPELSSPRVKEYVYLVAQELAESHPEWDVDTFYSNLGPETKKRLGIEKLTGKSGGTGKGKATPGSGMNKASGNRPISKRKVGSLEAEVAESLGI